MKSIFAPLIRSERLIYHNFQGGNYNFHLVYLSNRGYFRNLATKYPRTRPTIIAIARTNQKTVSCIPPGRMNWKKKTKTNRTTIAAENMKIVAVTNFCPRKSSKSPMRIKADPNIYF